jgi:lipopolysaccharide export system protein LptA
VKLNQPLRKSSAGELRWSQESGLVYLFKNAKVFHQKWGEAQGEEIIIHENDGHAEVIGGSEGRSRLILPPLGKNKSP